MEYHILSRIQSPADVRALKEDELPHLCDEIRKCIIENVSKNGGHLSSNLGAVELTVALHRVFQSPDDAILFDVGHQSYTHKLLTGRFDRFDTLRQKDGLSGFMRPAESEHDAFVSGHSSNSISAAYGIYKAKQLRGESGTAIAVIGDGAMTGGMAYEALNNAGTGHSGFIVVLNDNKMSISRNVGAVARAFTRLRNRPHYHSMKFAFGRFLLKIPLVGKPLFAFFDRLKNLLKSIVYRNNIFSALGFNYLGPVNGHDIKTMETLFRAARQTTRPALIHVVTTKGKGYTYAEEKPNSYHGVAPFDSLVGKTPSVQKSYSDIAGETLCTLAENDDRICAVTAAMAEGTGLRHFAELYRNRFFDVGIAEQHAVTFSAGLAKGGMIPFFAVYSSFLQRAYDQILHDIAIDGLPVKLLVDRAGIVGEDGESHQGLFDAAYLSTVPGMKIYSPSTYTELQNRIRETAGNTEICAIRYPRGFSLDDDRSFDGNFTVVNHESNRAIVTYGRLFFEAEKAVTDRADIIKLNCIYPLDAQLPEICKKYGQIDFFEEGIRSGGIAEQFGAMLEENGFAGEYKVHAIDNCFVPAADTFVSLADFGLNADAMSDCLKAVVE